MPVRFLYPARLSLWFLIAICLFSTGCVQAQHASMTEGENDHDDLMPLYEKALGTYTFPVTTSSEKAQAYMDQGIQMMFAFAKGEAPKAFEAAQKLDPKCAMCAWGEAWSLGPYLNGAMNGKNAPKAYAAIERAKDLAQDNTTALEKALIDAMAARYEPEHDQERRKTLDSLYAQALETVYQQYPEALLVGTLYGEALMLLEPRRGMKDASDPDMQRIHTVLEDVLARDVTQPGACHLYIHATEATDIPGKAEACADHLGNAIPGASHINHMPSHTYNRIGRWGDAVRANIQAWHSDLKAEYDEGFAIYPSHNLHMLLFAAAMDGQGGVAIQAGRDYGKLMERGDFYLSMALVRFGRFEEILELDDSPTHPVLRGYWDFAKGYAELRVGKKRKASEYLDRVQHAAQTTPDTLTFRGHTADLLLGTLGGILEGEILRSDNELEQAISIFEKAVQLEDSLAYDEPEPIIFSARTWLGAALLEAEKPAEAEQVFRDALVDHPNNGWDLYGLREALYAQDKDAEARDIHDQFMQAWERADTWIRSPRF